MISLLRIGQTGEDDYLKYALPTEFLGLGTELL